MQSKFGRKASEYHSLGGGDELSFGEGVDFYAFLWYNVHGKHKTKIKSNFEETLISGRIKKSNR